MMSAIHSAKEWTEWHLTPHGWVNGACMLDEVEGSSEPCPADRVLTYHYKRVQGPISHASRSLLKLVWCNDDQELIQHLIRKYGDCLHQTEAAA